MATSFGQIEELAREATDFGFRQLEERVRELEQALKDLVAKKEAA